MLTVSHVFFCLSDSSEKNKLQNKYNTVLDFDRIFLKKCNNGYSMDKYMFYNWNRKNTEKIEKIFKHNKVTK